MELSLQLIILILTFIIDVLIQNYIRQKSVISRNLSLANVLLVMFVSSAFLFTNFNIFSLVLMIVSFFRVINYTRVIEFRMNPIELYSRFIRSALLLNLTSLILVFFTIKDYEVNVIELLSVLSLIGAIILFANTIYSIIRWRVRKLDITNDKNLPTVSVCIPARNETADLPLCIETVLASTYPKLEVLVLDDCSYDKTPAIIKEYAHQGVRFITGQEPKDSWIAKNSAMNKLFLESRGDIVVFAGVDVRFNEKTVQRIVEQLEHGLLDMISVLPIRNSLHESTVFIQPLRYWWEIAVPRLFGKRPPALSTLWAVRRKRLMDVGGFESVKKSVRPEAHFAKRLTGAYRFVLSGDRLGITSVKGAREQFDTALRMRYPQARKRPESVLALILIELIIFITPILTIIYGVINSEYYWIIIGVLSISLLTLVNLYISRLTVKKLWFIGLVSTPFLLIEEWYILIRSMLAYEFGIVKWKERNVCLPMLQPEKELPKL